MPRTLVGKWARIDRKKSIFQLQRYAFAFWKTLTEENSRRMLFLGEAKMRARWGVIVAVQDQ
jgi:hypothetical protein